MTPVRAAFRLLATLAFVALAGAPGCTGRPAPSVVGTQHRSAASDTNPLPRAFATVYTCQDEFRFSARPRGDSIAVVLPTGIVMLPQVRAASGARYMAGDIELWSKGPKASLVGDAERHVDCRGRPAETAWHEAQLLGIEFRAVGQEPGWSLDLDEGRSLRFVGDYGALHVLTPAPAPVADSGGGVRYSARTEAHDLSVSIREVRCLDAMSGQPFTHSVTVRLDGRTFAGCGRPLITGDLVNAYWRLTELDGGPVVGGTGQEAHLRLIENGTVALGSTGCNRFRATAERDGDRIHFRAVTITRMACAGSGADRQERRFVEALGRVDRFAILNDGLTLYAGTAAAARFVAVWFR